MFITFDKKSRRTPTNLRKAKYYSLRKLYIQLAVASRTENAIKYETSLGNRQILQ